MNKNIPEAFVIGSLVEEIGRKFFNNIRDSKERKGKSFEHLCLSIICNIDQGSIDANDITGGDGDLRIDAIHIEKDSEGGENINIFDCTTSGGHSPSEISLLSNEGLSYIFEKSPTDIKALTNTKLRNKILYINKHSRIVKSIDVSYCVFNNEDENGNLTKKIESVKKRYEGKLKTKYNNPRFDFHLVNSYKLFLKKQNNEEPLSREKTIVAYDKPGTFCFANEEIPDIKGSLVTISGLEIARLVNRYGDNLFEKNIRDKLKSKTNKDITNFIEDSAREEQAKFWFLNNGITMTCNRVLEVQDRGQDKLELTNPQIVNGQQTAFCLQEVKNRNRLRRNVKVICRIVQTESYEFAKEIAKTSNTQSKIDAGDLISNDPKQIAISDFLAARGYFYRRKKGVNKSSGVFKKLIAKKVLARVSMALINRKPSVARRNEKEKLFYREYTKVFDHDPRELLLASLVYKYCQKLTKKYKKNTFGRKTAFHLASILWQILHLENNDLEDKIDLIIETLEREDYRILKYKKAIKTLKKIIRREAKLNKASPSTYIQKKEFQTFLNAERSDRLISMEIHKLS